MPEGKRKVRVESSVVVPVRSPKRYRIHSEPDSDGEHQARKWRERRRPSPLKWESKNESRNIGNRRIERHEREELSRDRDQSRGLSRRIPDQSVRESLEQRRSNGNEVGLRHSNVMDLDPSDVPRGGKYFLHDNRESGSTTFNQRSSWVRGRGRGDGRRGDGRRGDGRRGDGRRDNRTGADKWRRSRSPNMWKHDKFEQREAEDDDHEETLNENEKAEAETEQDKK